MHWTGHCGCWSTSMHCESSFPERGKSGYEREKKNRERVGSKLRENLAQFLLKNRRTTCTVKGWFKRYNPQLFRPKARITFSATLCILICLITKHSMKLWERADSDTSCSKFHPVFWRGGITQLRHPNIGVIQVGGTLAIIGSKMHELTG